MSQLNEGFISSARRNTLDNNLPISAKKAQVPLIATNKWEKVGEPLRLTKVFVFREIEQRNNFVIELLAYELEIEHNSEIFIDEKNVKISVMTKTIEQITEIDHEYSKYADELYRDVVYNIHQ